jgi:hypothetical protein
VTRAGVEQFVADLDNLGRDFLGRYVVFTTSGSTGVPALLMQDRRAIAVITGLSYVRALDRACVCGSPLATISVYGRTDEILRIPRAGVVRRSCSLWRSAPWWKRPEASAGTRCCRRRRVSSLCVSTLIQMRIEPTSGSAPEQGWPICCGRTAPVDVRLRLASEPPQVSPRNGKLRHVLRSVRLVAS